MSRGARAVSLLFQNVALFPHLTGFENIAFPLRAAGERGRRIEQRVGEVAGKLGVGHLLGRYPRDLFRAASSSGSRSGARWPAGPVVMLDEPLSNLDARTRIALRIEFKALHRELGQTILYVTHDQVEAMSLSDRIAVLSEGGSSRSARRTRSTTAPPRASSAEFVGAPPMNILEVELEDRSRGRW